MHSLEEIAYGRDRLVALKTLVDDLFFLLLSQKHAYILHFSLHYLNQERLKSRENSVSHVTVPGLNPYSVCRRRLLKILPQVVYYNRALKWSTKEVKILTKDIEGKVRVKH